MKESNVKLTYTSRIKNYVRETTGLMNISEVAKLSDKKLIELLTHSSPGSDREKIVIQAIKAKLQEAERTGRPPPYLDQAQTFKTSFGGTQTYTLMTAAAKYGHTDVVNLLKDIGVDPAKSMRTNSKGLTGSAQEYLEINEKNGGPPRRQYYNSEKAAIAVVAGLTATGVIIGTGGLGFIPMGVLAIPGVSMGAIAGGVSGLYGSAAAGISAGYVGAAGLATAGYAGAAGLATAGYAGAAGLVSTGIAGAAGLATAGYAGAAGVVTTIGTALGIAGTAVGTTGMGAVAGKIAIDVAAGIGAITGVTFFAAGTYALMKKVKNTFTKSSQSASDKSVKLIPKYNQQRKVTTYADSKGKVFLESSLGKDGKAIFEPKIAAGMKVVIPSPRIENGKPVVPPQYEVIELDHNGKLLATRVIPPLAFGEKPKGESSINKQWLDEKYRESGLSSSLGTIADASDRNRTTITSVSSPVREQTPDTSYKFKAEDCSISLNSGQLTIGKQDISGQLIYEMKDVVKIKPIQEKDGNGIKFVILPPNNMKEDEKIEIKYARMDGNQPCTPPQFDLIELDSGGRLRGAKIISTDGTIEEARGTSAISKKWLDRLQAEVSHCITASTSRGMHAFRENTLVEYGGGGVNAVPATGVNREVAGGVVVRR